MKLSDHLCSALHVIISVCLGSWLVLPTDRAWKEVLNSQEEEKVTPPKAMCREGAPEIL